MSLLAIETNRVMPKQRSSFKKRLRKIFVKSESMIVILLSAMLASFCAVTIVTANPSDETVLVRDNTAFAIDLYQALRKPDGNIFFSPYSISSAFALAFAGARGDTEKQMAKTLRFSSGQKVHPAFSRLQNRFDKLKETGLGLSVNIANSIWPQRDYKLLDTYVSLIKESYGVSIEPIDYKTDESRESARKLINGWVEEKTNKKISEILGPGVLNASTRLVLVDAVYFKGNWKDAFLPANTKNSPFYLTEDKIVQTPMMTRTSSFKYAEDKSLQILEMSYLGDGLSIIVLLPRERDGLKELEAKLYLDYLDKMINHLSRREVEVFLPKFKVTSSFELNETLIGMGMSDAFRQEKADFSGMDGNVNSLFIGSALHKTYIQVDEEGSEAAAVTDIRMAAVEARIEGPPIKPPIFQADHPFVFLIRDNETGTILFMGRVNNPIQQE